MQNYKHAWPEHQAHQWEKTLSLRLSKSSPPGLGKFNLKVKEETLSICQLFVKKFDGRRFHLPLLQSYKNYLANNLPLSQSALHALDT